MAALHIRIDEKKKKEVQKILDDLGLDMSTAVNMYFHQIALKQGIPFDISKERFVPTYIMKEWEREAQEAISSGKSYANAQEMMTDILSEDDDA
jgi:DNA-damage-inducible protein J